MRVFILLFLSCLLVPLSAQSKKAEKLVKKGKAAMEKNQFVGATVHFTNALAINPKNGETYYLRGYSFLAVDQKTIAEEDFKKAIELDENGINAYMYLFSILRNDGRCEESFHYIDKLENINKDYSGAAHYQRALCYEKMKSIDKAIASYQHAADFYLDMGPDAKSVLEDCRNKIKNLKKL